MASRDNLQTEHPFICTTEQVIGLAPDKHHIRTSRGFAVLEKWTQLGHTGELIWGILPIKGKPSLSVVVHLNQLALCCSCKSRKYPCSHLLSILLLYAESPESFSALAMPEALADFARTAQLLPNETGRTAGKKRTPNVKRRNQRRRKNITAGLLELELWLHDMVENGLAAVQDYPKTYWTAMADRLVDYQVGEIAYQIRAMGQLPGKEVDWHEMLLNRISQLYLLIQGFKRFDDLPPTMQMDLRMAVGWLPHPDEVAPANDENGWETVADSWLVLGKRTELRGKQTLQRTWLWGVHTNRPALLLDVVSKSSQQSPIHIVGSTMDVSLRFAPTTTNLYAQIETPHAAQSSTAQIAPPIQLARRQGDQFVRGFGSVHEAVAHHRNAITQNPWLRYMPIALHNVTIDAVDSGASDVGGAPLTKNGRNNERWGLRDFSPSQAVENSGSPNQAECVSYLLPLPPKFDHLWYLRSLSRHQPLTLFGEWDGEHFTPLSLWHDGRLLETRVLGGAN